MKKQAKDKTTGTKPALAALGAARARQHPRGPEGIMRLKGFTYYTDEILAAEGWRLLTPEEFHETFSRGAGEEAKRSARAVPLRILKLAEDLALSLCAIIHGAALQKQIAALVLRAEKVHQQILAALRREDAIDAAAMKFLAGWHKGLKPTATA